MGPRVGEWVHAAPLAEVRRRRRLAVTVAGRRIALFLVGGDVYALDDTCVHKQRSLSKGAVLNGRVICPGHQWVFDPATGAVEGRDECQPVHAVRVDGDAVYVAVPPQGEEP
ncbi:Rieske 2Fe-2S domain-containing protein [Actinomadura chibensis]|uniref:Rieske 2Fe-2S domain-containing protein n=1 Tax=Actinomadura chibensis TaxID=392828 RepID=A0A5D0NS26_9ACTN|nr:Rieske 2Fe-2S domain-containing protein [Actinomadura chibensis]